MSSPNPRRDRGLRTRAVVLERPRDARRSSADAAKLSASRASSVAGWAKASASPTSGGHHDLGEGLHGPDVGIGLRDAVAPDQRRQRPEGGTVEEHREGRPEERDRQDVRHRQHVEPVRHRDAGQQHPGQQVGAHHHPPTVPAVAERTGEQPEEQVRRCLQRGDQRGERRRAAEPVDQHRQRDQRRDRADQRQAAGGGIAEEVVVPQQRCRWSRSVASRRATRLEAPGAVAAVSRR